MDFLVGAAGFAKEVFWLISELGMSSPPYYKIEHVVSKEQIGEKFIGLQIIDETHFGQIIEKEPNNNAFISIGDFLIRARIYERFKDYKNLHFPTVIHPSVLYDQKENKVAFGIGSIICAGNILTTDITIGNFVHLNLGCTVGHDSSIHDFVTVSPGCHISGNVTVGKRVFIGTGAVILEKVTICEDVIIGAGAVVAKSIMEAGTYVGVPAKKIK